MADSISLSGASSVNVGSSITITATGEFGSGYNSYRLYARTTNSKASVSPTYRTGYEAKDDFTTTFSVTGSAAGSETLYVYIQGSTNGTTWSNVTYATKSITVSGSTPSASWTTKPSGASLTYPSSSYLCTTGTPSNGTAYYGLTSTKSSMSTTRPTASGYAPGSVTVYFYVKGNSGYNDSAVESTTATISKGTPGWSLSPTTVRGWTYDTKIITISSYSSYSSLSWTTSSSGLDYSTRSGAYCYLSKYSAGLGTLTVKTAADTYYNAVTKYGYGYFYGKPTTRTGLVYTGSAQQLLSSDATYSSSQTFYYKVTTTSSTPSSGYTSGYSSATGVGSSSSDTTYYVHVSTSNGSSGYIGYVTVTITGKSKATWTTQPTSNNSTYNGNYKEISTEGTTSQGTVKYRSRPDGGTWSIYSTDIPTAQDAGTYNIEAYIVGDSSHQDSDHVTFNTVISQYQLDASITLASTMTYNTNARNLVYSGSVINPGSTTGKGTLYYALGSNGTTAPTSGWSTSIPTGTNAGTYYVWYKVDTADSTNCLSKSATYKGSVTINQKSITITAPTINTATLTYTATDKTLASNGSVSDTTGATFKIGLGSSGSSAPSTWHSSDAITAVNAGTYYVWYKAVLNDSTNYTVDTSNHYLGSKAIGKAALTVTGSSHTVTYGDATPTVSVSYSGFKGSDTAAGVFSTLPTASTTYTSTTSVSSSPVAVTVTAGSTPTNYSVTYVNGAITINKKAPTITWVKKPTSVGYGQTTTDALQASADSGGTISFEIGDTTIADLNSDNTITGVKVGSTTVYVYVDTTTNYLAGSASYGFSVTKVAPTYTAPTNATPTYSGSAQYICTTGSCTGGTISYYASTSSSSATGGSWSTTRPTLTSCGINRYVWWKITGDSNHTDKDPAYVGSVSYIAKKFLTVTASSHTVTYGDAKPTLSVSYSGFVTGESASNLTTAPTASTTYTSSTPVSSSPVPTTADGGVADNYSFIYQDGSITINKANSSASSPTYVRPVYNGTDQYICSLALNVVGGTAQYYASTSSSSATGGSWSSSRPTLKNCGTTRYVWWKIVGDANHNDKAAAYIGTSSYIQKKTVSLTWGTVTWVYDGATHSTTCTVGSLIEGDTCTATLTGNSVGKNVGSVTVTASALSNSNYALPSANTTTISITQKEVTLSWGTHSWTYDKTEKTVTCTAGSLISGDTCTVTLSNNTRTNVGSQTVTATGLSNGNYKLPSGTTTTLTISQREVTLTWGTTSWVYDKSTHSTTCTAGNVISGDTCTVTLSGNSVGAAVGSATVTATDVTNANYKLPSSGLSTTLYVTAKEVTLNWGTTSWPYDGSSHSTTCTAGNVISGDTCTVTLSGNSVGPNVGSATVTATALSNSNYKLPSTKTTTISISQIAAALALSSTSVAQFTTQTVTLSSYVSAHTGTCTYAIKTNGTTTPSTISGAVVTCGAMSSANDTNQSVVCTITDPGDTNHYQVAKDFTITVKKNAQTIAFNNSTEAVTYGSTLSVAATVTASHGTTGSLSYTTTGTYTSISGSTLTGTAYSGSSTDTITATAARTTTCSIATKTRPVAVQRRTVTLSWGTVTWTYDGATHSTTCTAGNLVGSDTCTVTLTGNSVGANVGTATVTASSLSNSNYALPASTTNTLTINQREVTLSWGTLSWTYDGNTHSTTCNPGNLVSGDVCTVTLTGNSVGKNVGTATVTASSLSNGNYKLPSAKTNTLRITAKTATLSWGTTSWTYDGSTHSTTCSVSNLVSGDTCTVTLSGNSVGKNVGSSTVTATALSNSNYALPSSASTTISITQKAVTLSWGTTTWTYDKSEKTVTCTAGSLVTGDSCTVTLSNNKRTNAGSQTVTATGLSNGNYKLPSSGTTTTLTINQREVSLVWGTLTWVYDKSTHSTSATCTNVMSGDTCTVTTYTGNSVGPNVGSSTVTATALSNSNYKLPSSASNIISITQKTVTLSWGTHTWTYDGTEKTVTCSIDSSSIITGDTCTVTGITGNKRTNAGSQTVTVTTLSNSNYKLPSDPTTTLTINKFNLSATVTLSSTMTYNGSERNLASGTVVNPGSTTGKGTLKFALGSNGTTAPSSGWVTDNPIKRTNVGTYYIWYKVDAVDTTNCNSLAATYKGTVTINKANVTITITSPVSVSWTGTSGNTTSYTRNSNSSVTFSASTNFGTITYASSDSSVATINSSGVLTCAYWGGSCTLTISVAGTDNYNGASGTVSLTTLNVSNTKIYVDGQWKTVTPYIYTADGWKRCVAVIYTADGWKKC